MDPLAQAIEVAIASLYVALVNTEDLGHWQAAEGLYRAAVDMGIPLAPELKQQRAAMLARQRLQ